MSTPAERPELDACQILRRLTAAGVDFVVIGGIAAVLHGSPRLTFDLDICYATDRANLRALGQVLDALGARPRGITDDLPFAADERTLGNVELLTLTTDAGDLDVLARPAGAPRYDALRRGAARYAVGGTVVNVASIDDLIAMKSVAGRAKDLADIEELEAIKRLERARRSGAAPDASAET